MDPLLALVLLVAFCAFIARISRPLRETPEERRKRLMWRRLGRAEAMAAKERDVYAAGRGLYGDGGLRDPG